MMKKIKKRLFALFMSFMMTLGIVIGPAGIRAGALDTPVDLATLASDYTISESGSYTFSGTLAAGYHIVVNPDISGDVNITLKDVEIRKNLAPPQLPPKNLTVSALEIGSGTTVNLELTGMNYLVGANAPGIHVPDGATLIIDGTGKLSTICNANSIAQSAAGIGGANGGTCGTITINGGALIKAIGFKNSAGIGSGYEGIGGTITINDGEVDASAGAEGGGAAIGSGFKAKGNCSITINGGKVRASSIDVSAAIGNGYGSTGAKVTITGGSVTAVTGGSGAAIGNGQGIDDHQSSCTVLISGGTVTATMDANIARMVGAAGIGGGARGNGCDVTITGGTVTAFGHTGIGPGAYGPSAGTCIVTGGSVKIESDNSAAQAVVCYDAAGTPAYPVSLTVPGVTAATEVSYAVSGGSSVTSTTDTDGKLYLWLPAQANAAVSVTAGSKTFAFSGAVSSTGTNTLTIQLSSEKAITAFNFNGLTPAVSGTINESGKTIALTVPYGTDLTALVPTITHTGASIFPNTGVAQNFSAPVTYTVTAEDSTAQPYIVSVTVSPAVETLANTLNLAGFTTAVSGSTVTVTGTKVATDTLKLAIPAGVTVQWKASLTGDVSPYLVFLNGDGTFELAGGKITNTGTGMAVGCIQGSIVISGGTASSSSDNATVQTYYMGSTAPMLTMTGGNVISTSDELSSCAISAGGKTVITGGTITVASGNQVVLSNAVVVYQRGLLSKISSGSLSASVAVDPSKTYATPTETAGLTATGYSVLADHVTAQWNYSNSGWTGVQVDYSGSSSGSWQVSYPTVQVVSGRHSLSYLPNGGTDAVTAANTVYTGQSYTVSTNVFTRTDYTFTGWNTEADGTGTSYAVGATLVGGPGSDDILLYAQWSPTGSGITGGSSYTTYTTTVSGTTATTTVTPTMTNGAATGAVSADQMSDALKQAQAAAGASGTPNVTIQVGGAAGASSVGTTIPQASVQALVSGNAGALTISGPTGSVSFDAAALKTIAGASGDVTVTVAKTDSSALSAAAQALVGDHPVFSLSVMSGGSAVSQFGGDVTVSVPYTPAPGEDTNAIVIYYIAADGAPTLVPNARYDTATGRVVFTTTHFSTYAVGYNKVSFTDVSTTAWYADAVTFLAARGVTSGTTANTFSPDATLTRGQFMTMLLRAYSISPDPNPRDNFADAGNTYYTNYLATAKRMGLASGIGDNLFAPDREITRQEMFTILYSVLESTSNLPQGNSGKTLADFSDTAEIASWAKDAMTLLVGTGTVSGSGGKLSPTSFTTRAEMAEVLYRLLGE